MTHVASGIAALTLTTMGSPLSCAQIMHDKRLSVGAVFCPLVGHFDLDVDRLRVDGWPQTAQTGRAIPIATVIKIIIVLHYFDTQRYPTR